MNDATEIHNNLPPNYPLEEYQILNVLGEGGFGVTYKAMDTRLQRLVAIKEFLPSVMAVRNRDLSVQPRTQNDLDQYLWGQQRFLDEARTLAQFRHPNIVSVVRLFEAHGTAYIVMEYEAGKDLSQVLREQNGPLPEEQLVKRILLPLLDGLEQVHAKGILHRDIKPSNVYIREDGSPVLLDFGSARQDLGQKSQMLTSVVSSGYSPLEQYGSSGRQGPWTDLYALGGTLYFAMTGKKPPDAVDRIAEDRYIPARQAALRPYSEGLCNAVDAVLRMKAEERPQTIAAFRALVTAPTAAVDEATRVLTPSAKAAAAEQTRLRTQPKDSQPATDALQKSNRTALILGATLVLLVAVAGGLFWVTSSSLWQKFGPTLAGEPAAASTTLTESHAAHTVGQQPANASTTSEPVALPASLEPAPAGTLEPAIETQPASLAPPPATDPEDDILATWNLALATQEARKTHITGTLLAYIRSRQQFDQCLQQGCAELATLKKRLDDSRQSPWQRDDVQGDILIQAGAKTSVIGCTWRLEVEEHLTTVGGKRRQSRVYCTNNGLDRSVESHEPAVNL